MSLFTTLATYDQIRTATGVSVKELSNDELDNSGIEFDVELEVSTWLPSSASLTQIYDDGSDPAATQQQKCQMYAMAAYCKYAAAYFLMQTGVMKFAKKLSDSNNAIERDSRDDEKLLKVLAAQMQKYKNKFLELYNEPADEFDTAIFMGSVSPNFDPVTG
jgi:hypothetical protein